MQPYPIFAKHSRVYTPRMSRTFVLPAQPVMEAAAARAWTVASGDVPIETAADLLARLNQGAAFEERFNADERQWPQMNANAA